MEAERCTWLALLPGYALGALDVGDRVGVEAHLRLRCPECELELARLRLDVQALAESAPPVAPAPEARDGLLAAVRPRSWVPGRAPLAAAAVVAILVAAGSLGWGAALATRLDGAERESRRLAVALSAAEARLAGTRIALDAAERALGVLGGAGLRQVQLRGLEAAPGASAQGLVDPATRQVLLAARGLPPLGAGRTYQLWWIASGTPIPAGTFDRAVDGRARLVIERMPQLERIEAWAVTEEPSGGAPSPTGPVLLKG
jgi:anti-sigma-K factor RskA